MNADLLRSKIEAAVEAIPERVMKAATGIRIDVDHSSNGATISISPPSAIECWIDKINFNAP